MDPLFVRHFLLVKACVLYTREVWDANEILTECYLKRVKDTRLVKCAFNCGLQFSNPFIGGVTRKALTSLPSVHGKSCIVPTLCYSSILPESRYNNVYPTCTICLDREVKVVFGNCGHSNICEHCLNTMYQKKRPHEQIQCPTCRIPITGCEASCFKNPRCDQHPVGAFEIATLSQDTECVICHLTPIHPRRMCVKQECESRTFVCKHCETNGRGDAVISCSKCNGSVVKIFT